MSNPTKKVIVSGASGQDGSYMIEYLLANTDNTVIAALRRTSQAILTNLQGVLNNPRVKMVTVDLCDSEAVRGLIRDERPDYFINFGAQSFVADSWKNPVAHLQTNAISLVHILEAIREYVPQCRLYSAGSSEQWGDVKYSPQDEKHPLSPRSIYGVSKCAAEFIVKVYRESYGLYAVHGKLLNHESERRQAYFVTRKISLGVARIYHAIKKRPPGWGPSILDGRRVGPHHAVVGIGFEPIELGNLDAMRDWSHAEDFVDGIWKMLNQDTRNPQEYVLSSGSTHSIREFVELAFKAAPFNREADAFFWDGLPDKPETEAYYYRNIKLKFWPPAESVVVVNPVFYRPADVQTLHGDSTRARTELGWSPKVSFSELVQRMVKHDIEHYNG